MTQKVKTYKKYIPKGVLLTSRNDYIVLEVDTLNRLFNEYDLNKFLVVPYLKNPDWTSDHQYPLYGRSRSLYIQFATYQAFEVFDGDPILVWDGNYIEVPDGVEPEDYFITDEQEEEFAFPVTQAEFDRIFDTYYDDDKENE